MRTKNIGKKNKISVNQSREPSLLSQPDKAPSPYISKLQSIIPIKNLETLCAFIFLIALSILFIRASFKLESRWDSLTYHIPFAALRAGIGINYEMPIIEKEMYQGFPPLVSFLQGVLWKITGSINATGIVNYMAFVGFLIYGHKMLKSPFWLVGMIALSAPLVLIHTATNYDDLCGNCFLAIGLTSLGYMYLFPNKSTRWIFLSGLLAGIATAWSKFILVPIDVIFALLMTIVSLKQKNVLKLTHWQIVSILLAAAFVAAAPYVKNLILYANPFWPLPVPLFEHIFPHGHIPSNQLDLNAAANRPDFLTNAPQYLVFVHSLFEINHPTYYPDRPRWIIDQGNAWIAYRAGGFWSTGVILYISLTTVILPVVKGRRGWIAAAFFIGIICLTGFLPQSNELRYYLFMPLMWAGIIGILYKDLGKKKPLISLSVLTLVISLFGYMMFENRGYYAVNVTSYQDIAQARGMTKWWDILDKNKTYCAVDVGPFGLLLTGPTMKEYTIVARNDSESCPTGSTVISKQSVPNNFGKFSGGTSLSPVK